MADARDRFTPGALVTALADLVAPVVCGGCGSPGEPWCGRCATRLADDPRLVLPRTPVAATVWAHGAYRDPLRSAIVAVKEHRRRDLIEPLGEALARSLVTLSRWQELPDADDLVLIPAPTRLVAARRRGGDPVEGYCRAAARRLGPRVCVAPVLRTAGWVRDSAGLAASARGANLRGTVLLLPRRLRALDFSSSTIILVDDVMTTGATAAESVRVLHHHGVVASAVLVLAAAD